MSTTNSTLETTMEDDDKDKHLPIVQFYEPIFFHCIEVTAGEKPPFGKVSMWKSAPYESFTRNAIGMINIQELFGDKVTRVVMVPAKNNHFNLYEVSHLHCCWRYKPGKPYSRLPTATILMGENYWYKERYEKEAKWANLGFLDLEQIFSSILERAVVMPWKNGNTAIYNVKPLRAVRPAQIPRAAKQIDRNRGSALSQRQTRNRKLEMKIQADAIVGKENHHQAKPGI